MTVRGIKRLRLKQGLNMRVILATGKDARVRNQREPNPKGPGNKREMPKSLKTSKLWTVSGF